MAPLPFKQSPGEGQQQGPAQDRPWLRKRGFAMKAEAVCGLVLPGACAGLGVLGWYTLCVQRRWGDTAGVSGACPSPLEALLPPLGAPPAPGPAMLHTESSEVRGRSPPPTWGM